MQFDFNNKVVFLTGSTGGIGISIAKKFNEFGATLICSGTNKEKLNNLKNLIGSNHYFYKIDLNDNTELENTIDDIIIKHSKIDILINNAGLNSDNLSLRLKNEEWDKVININLTSNFKIIKKIAPLMIKAKTGRIIGISSVVAFTGNKGQANYTASKSGMIGLYKSLALEYASRGITINIIAPGFIQTKMTDKLESKQIENISSKIPLNKLGNTEDIAFGALYLASEEAGYITGQTLHINGGMLMV